MYDIAKHLNWPERRYGEFESNSSAQAAHFSFCPSHYAFSVFGTYPRREITHRMFFSRERQRGSHDLIFPALAVCRRGGHFSRLEETRKREYLQLVCTDYCFIFIVYFCSYASRFGFPCVQVSFGICETMES